MTDEISPIKPVSTATLALKSFQGFVEQQWRFRFGPDEKHSVLVTLVEAKATRAPGEGAPASIRQEPFSLLFEGPTEPPIFQGLVILEHSEFGISEPLLTTYVGPINEGRAYEIVFG